MNPKIILLNGASSSGKSTLSIPLQKILEVSTGERYGIVSLDDYLVMSVNKEIYEDDVFDVSPALCKAAVDMANAQINVIIDHVITSKRVFLQLAEALEACDVYMIHITCPLHELRRREQQRGNRFKTMAEASLQYLFPTKTYDLSIDTFQLSTDECAQQIKTALLNKPKAVQTVRYIAENDLIEN